MKISRKIFWGSLSFFVVALVWEMLAGLHLINIFILPAPHKILQTLIELCLTGELFNNLAVSLVRVVIGFVIATSLAIPIGLLIAFNKFADELIFPLLNFLRPIPPIAWMPLAILWFGIGHGPALFLTMIASFFSVLLGTIFGVNEISKDHLNVAKCFEASKWLTFKSIIIPAILPQVLNSLRIGFGLSWMAVIGAEMISSSSGIGHMINVAQDSLRSDIVIVGMLAIGFTGFMCDLFFKKIIKNYVLWKEND